MSRSGIGCAGTESLCRLGEQLGRPDLLGGFCIWRRSAELSGGVGFLPEDSRRCGGDRPRGAPIASLSQWLLLSFCSAPRR